MDREMWILRQLETSLTASAEALAERLQVSPRTITNAINTLNRMLAPAASVRPTGGIVRASFRLLERQWRDESLYAVAVHTRVPFVR